MLASTEKTLLARADGELGEKHVQGTFSATNSTVSFADKQRTSMSFESCCQFLNALRITAGLTPYGTANACTSKTISKTFNGIERGPRRTQQQQFDMSSRTTHKSRVIPPGPPPTSHMHHPRPTCTHTAMQAHAQNHWRAHDRQSRPRTPTTHPTNVTSKLMTLTRESSSAT